MCVCVTKGGGPRLQSATLLLDTDKSAEEAMMQPENRAKEGSEMVGEASAGGGRERRRDAVVGLHPKPVTMFVTTTCRRERERDRRYT